MFFSGSVGGQKVSLGGRRAQEPSREELLQRSRDERQKRQRRKEEENKATIIQAAWRAARRRAELKREWTRELTVLLASSASVPPASQLLPSGRLVPLVWRVYDPATLQQLPLLTAVCRLILSTKTADGRLAFMSCVGEEQGRQVVNACALAAAIVATLRRQRWSLHAALSAPLGAPTPDATLSSVAVLVQTLLAIVNPASWLPSGVTAPQRAPAVAVISRLADSGLFGHLALILAACLPVQPTGPTGPGAPACAADALATQLVARYMAARAHMPPAALAHHQPWRLLCVPALFQRSRPLAALQTHIGSAALRSLQASAPADLMHDLAAHAARVGFVQLPARAPPPPGDAQLREDAEVGVAQCALTLCAALLQAAAPSLTSEAAKDAGAAELMATAFMAVTRSLVAMVPASAATALTGGVDGPPLRVPRAACSGSSEMQVDADPDDVYAGERWYLPPGVSQAAAADALLRRAGGRSTATLRDGDDPPAPAPRDGGGCFQQDVVFPVRLTSRSVVAAVAAAALSSRRSDSAVTVQSAAGAQELSHWLHMLIALSSPDAKANSFMDGRQQLLILLSSPELRIIRRLWSGYLQPMQVLTRGSLQWSHAADVTPSSAAQLPPQSQPRAPPFAAGACSAALASLRGVAPWLAPMLVLCQVYSRYALSAPQEELFGDAAPIPSDQLASATRRADGFVPLLRSMLFYAFIHTSGSSGGRGAPLGRAGPGVGEAGVPDAGLQAAFKVLCGRLLCQLHDRASRTSALPMDVFHADIVRGQFHAEVELAIRSAAGLGLARLQHESSAIVQEYDAGEGEAERGAAGAYVEMLRFAPCLVPFEDRALVFHSLIDQDRAASRSEEDWMQDALLMGGRFVTVRRNELLSDSYRGLELLPSTALKQRIRIRFIDEYGDEEAGIDGGGLFKEFMERLVKEAFDAKAGLFLQNEEGELHPNPIATQVIPEAIGLFHFLGRMVGKALYEGIIVELPLAGFFLKKVRGGLCDVNDLPSLDSQLYKNLTMLRSFNGDVADLGLTFTIATRTIEGGDALHSRDVELVPGGSHVQVTSSNASTYVMEVANYRLNRESVAASTAFLRGLFDMIQPSWLRMFNEQELQTLISGSNAGLDLQDLKANVEFGSGYYADHPVIQNLWKVLSEFGAEDQSAFLRFVTSCSRPPLLGFKYLQPRLSIGMRGGVLQEDAQEALPTASTCVNLLKLPPYQDLGTMRSKLLLAIQSGAGFGLS